jgi:hypothetical protein
VLGCVDGKEFRKKRTEVEVFARASWGAAVLRPYTDVRDERVEVTG